MANRKVYTGPNAGARALADQKKLEARFEKLVLVPAQYTSALKTERKVVKASPVDRSEYKNNWKVTRHHLARNSRVQLQNDAPHAGVLEGGARPFWPPIKPLIEWAERKAGDLALSGKIRLSPSAFRVNKSGFLVFKGKAGLDDYDRDAVLAFAYGVQRKIAREGLPALWIMRRHLPYAVEQLARATERNIRKHGNLSRGKS